MKAKITSRTLKALEPQAKAFEVVDTEIKGFLLRVQPTGRQTFYFTYRADDGKRKRIKIGVLGAALTIQQARDIAMDMAARVAKGEDIQEERKESRQQARETGQNTLERFIDHHYKPWALANLKSGQANIDSIHYSFPKLLSKPLNKIRVSEIESWRTQKLEAGIKPSTLNRCVNALRGVLTKAVEWEFIEEHPLKRLKQLHVDAAPKVRYLLPDEEERLFAALKARDQETKDARRRGNEFRRIRGYELMPDLSHLTYPDHMTPLILVSLKTGMRQGEAFDLTWDNVNLDHKHLTVVGETAKSKTTRHIPLSPTAHDALSTWASQKAKLSGRVFLGENGERLGDIRKSWGNILKAAGIEKFRWHDMRHDFASKLVMKGVPLNTVRELCGHSDLNTTLRYAHLAPDHKADAVALIG